MATALLPDQRPATLAPRWPVVRFPQLDRFLVALVAVAALAGAAVLLRHYQAGARHLWTGAVHDRNAHYLTALHIGQGIRHADPRGAARELYLGTGWGPLHGLLVGATIALVGPEERWAVLPNLLAWAGMVVVAFLLARRVVAANGNLAGLTAALFVAASPTHRAFATDFMIESLGAFLTLLTVYWYVVAVQEQGAARPARWLALALTLLFFAKYNYWLLVVIPLLLATAPLAWRVYGPALRGFVASPRARAWLARQLGLPTTWVLAAVVVALVAGWSLRLAGKPVTLGLLGTLAYVGYLVLAFRCLPFWRGAGRQWLAAQPAAVRSLAAWHVLPIAVSFLVPRRLGAFLWWIGYPHGERTSDATFIGSLRLYADWFVADYHASTAGALLAVCLFVVALVMVARQRLRPGAAAIVVMVALALVLTAKHPNRKSRFLVSWLPVAWVGTGVGLASLLGSRALQRRPALRSSLGLCMLAGLAALQAPTLVQAGRAPEGGVHLEQPSDLDLTDLLLPELDAVPRTLVLSNIPLRFLVQWNVLARDGHLSRLDQRWWGFADKSRDNATGFHAWLENPGADTIVVLRYGPSLSDFFTAFPECRAHAEAADLLQHQSHFHLAATRERPRHDCTIQIWRRNRPAQ